MLNFGDNLILLQPKIPLAWALTAVLSVVALASSAGNAATHEMNNLKSTRSGSELTVLFLGDSMSLSGFGKQFDERLRRDPHVKAVFTYMACGANPLSWLKEPPFTNVKTLCGFWSIESQSNSKAVKELRETPNSGSPRSQTIPKLDNLLATIRPDILIVQSDTNLLSLFRDGKTLLPTLHGKLLRNHIAPFLSAAAAAPRPLRKIYWIGAPTSGRVSAPIQQFVLDQVSDLAGSTTQVIDSRQLVSYPYRHMDVDNEHFEGVEMDYWADRVFAIVKPDLSRFASLTNPPERIAPTALPTQEPAVKRGAAQSVEVRARLAFKSHPLRVSEIAPYQESLAAYLYDVIAVFNGSYSEKQILVMHPAHIRLKVQALDQYKVGEIYRLRLRKLEGTAWQVIRARDESNAWNLEPYIQIEDADRFPGLGGDQSLGAR
jgi:hypothetical protein